MSSNERRERLLQILKKSDEPVKGSELSAAIPHVITSIMVPFPIPVESRELLSQFRETE